MEIFWANVKKLIKDQNTTQEWVANTSGISFRTFQNWMTRKRLPDADEAYKIAASLKTTVEFLVTGEEPRNYASEKLDKIIPHVEEIIRIAKQ